MAWNTTDESRTVGLSINSVGFPGGTDQVLDALLKMVVGEGCQRTGYKLHDGWCWGFAPRDIAGTDTLSPHGKAGGRAVDINAPNNGRGTRGDIPPKMVGLLEEFGFTWGGRWSWTDPMHFQADRGPRYYRRATKRAKARFVDRKLAYRISGRIFGRPRRAAQYLRGKLNKGKLHDEFHVKVVRAKG